MPRPSGARQLLTAALAEPQVLRAVLRAVGAWLRQNREAVLADRDAPPDLSQWRPQAVWESLVEQTVIPAVREVWTGRWQARRALRNPDAWRADYLRQVQSRLRAFPAESFEVVRRVLLDGIGRGESIPRLRDRIGRALDIDGPSRSILNRIMDAERIAEDPRASRGEREEARRRARGLYEALDDADRQWQWRAERIARTETISSFNAGEEAAAQAQADQFGDRIGKQWWATRDTRTRPSHRHAHGQTVPLGERFAVGEVFLRFPGDPTGPAGEVIHCRCVLLTVELE